MFRGGSNAAYGYGRVFREYPQAQVQQQGQRPVAPIIQPTGAIQLAPWVAEVANWAALNALISVVNYHPPNWPIGGPFVPLPFWWQELRHVAALSYTGPVLYLVQSAKPPAGGQPISFPRLGQWVPVAEDPRVPYRFRLPQAPPVPPPPLLSHGQWTPVTAPLDLAFYSFRLQLAQVGPSQALPAVWPVEVKNWAALNATSPVVYMVVPSKRPIELQLPLPPSTDRSRSSWAALAATNWVVYMVRLQASPTGGQAIPFPKLGQWIPLLPDPGVQYRVRLPQVAPLVQLGTPAWALELDNLPALMAMNEAVYQVRRSLVPLFDFPPPPAPWATELGHLAALTAPRTVVYLVRLGATPTIPSPAPPTPWMGEVSNWAALSASGVALYLVRLSARPIVDAPAPPSPWMTELDHLAAFTAPRTVIYLVRLGTGPILAAPPPPQAWMQQVTHGAAIQWKGAIVYLVQLGRPATPILPFGPRPFQYPFTPPGLDPVYYSFRLPRRAGPPFRIWVWDAGAGTWRQSIGVWVYDATAATWRQAQQLWVWDAGGGVWRKAT